jgi:carbamoyltransferase
MKVLGVNVGQTADGKPIYDGGACLIVDGKIVGAIAEERLTRRKHCGGFEEAVRFLLRRASLELADVDLVVVSCYGEEADLGLFPDLALSAAKRVEMIPSHHLSHAYSAFMPSAFDEALVIVVDNEGQIIGPRHYPQTWRHSMERLSMYVGRGTGIELLERDMGDEDIVSLGELYGNITHFVGFGSYQNAGKTMALAAFGDPQRFADVALINLLPGGRLHIPLRNEYENSAAEIRRYFREYGHELPPPRDPNVTPVSSLWEDLAAAVQLQLEEALLHKVRHWVKETGIRSLCLAGGVALNCVANRRLLDEVPLDRLYVQPNAGDQGQGLGNALYGWHHVLGRTERVEVPGVYLGGDYTTQECLAALQARQDRLRWRQPANLTGEVARLLADGAVIGWFQGRSEWGPRALGNRSILADPRRVEMRDHINRRIKHREPFRPFAPVVMLEEAERFFDLGGPMPYMTVIAHVRPSAAHLIPAAVHIDGTARVQTVTSDENPLLHRLLRDFYSSTDIPVLLNTSFNDQGEPIVETPEQAVACFERTGLDVLVLHDLIVQRRSG